MQEKREESERCHFKLQNSKFCLLHYSKAVILHQQQMY